MKILSCVDVAKIGEILGLDVPSCCGSCHYDEEEGYGDLCDIHVGDDVVIRVCCAKLTFVHHCLTYLAKRRSFYGNDD